jgi:hypothetical protein
LLLLLLRLEGVARLGDVLRLLLLLERGRGERRLLLLLLLRCGSDLRWKLEVERDGGGEHPVLLLLLLLGLVGLGTWNVLLLLLLLLLMLDRLSGGRTRDGGGGGGRVLTPRFGEGDLGEDEGEDAGLIRDGEEDEAVVGSVGEANDAALQPSLRPSASFTKRGREVKTHIRPRLDTRTELGIKLVVRVPAVLHLSILQLLRQRLVRDRGNGESWKGVFLSDSLKGGHLDLNEGRDAPGRGELDAGTEGEKSNQRGRTRRTARDAYSPLIALACIGAASQYMVNSCDDPPCSLLNAQLIGPRQHSPGRSLPLDSCR